MAIRKFIVGLIFVSFFSIGLGTALAGDWETIPMGKCTRGDGVVYKVVSKPSSSGNTHFGVMKCKDGSCEWKLKKGISEEVAKAYVKSKRCIIWVEAIKGDGDKMTMLLK